MTDHPTVPRTAFRTRPANIQAIRLTGPPAINGSSGSTGIAAEIIAAIESWPGCRVTRCPASLLIAAPNGLISVSSGDWLVRDEHGRVYPMDDNLFHLIFEPIGGDEIPPDDRPCVCETGELMARGCRCGGV